MSHLRRSKIIAKSKTVFLIMILAVLHATVGSSSIRGIYVKKFMLVAFGIKGESAMTATLTSNSKELHV
jgi:hypothetical protein